MTQKLSNTPKFLLLLVILMMGLLTGCERSGDKEEAAKIKFDVRAVMEMRKKAIETQDIELYKQVVFSGYNGGGVNHDGVVEAMQEVFDRYEKIEFVYQRSTVDMEMNSARMVGLVSYKAASMEKPVFDRERTIFRRVDGMWYISAGINVGLLHSL